MFSRLRGGAGASELLAPGDEGRRSLDVSPQAFMEELCTNAGGYSRFFKSLLFQYMTWYLAVVIVPAIFLDHHRCEGNQPWLAWLLYCAVVVAMVAMAVLMELSAVQRLGLLEAGEVETIYMQPRWQLPLLATVLWKLDTYTDAAFIFIARDCGSSLWWASLATFVFGVVFCQLVLNLCFACTDCDHELPPSFGFVMLDFKIVNVAIRQILPFDPDVSHLPVARPVTLSSSSHLIGIEKIVGDIAQVSIQALFLGNSPYSHGFVMFSILVGVLHCGLTVVTVMGECVQDERRLQSQGLQQGLVLKPLKLGTSQPPSQLGSLQSGTLRAQGSKAELYGSNGSCAAPPSVLGRPAAAPVPSQPSSSADRFDPNEPLVFPDQKIHDFDLL